MTQIELRGHKQAIRAFLRTEVWTEEKLCALLAHAQDKLSMWSCCCLIGVATADHALRPQMLTPENPWAADCETWGDHYDKSNEYAAETAFSRLGGNPGSNFRAEPPNGDKLRRSRIRPIILAELRRRSRMAEAAERAIVISPMEIVQLMEAK